jgi:FtsP/CotA-like multicopper oxidase with cupredoxin domain
VTPGLLPQTTETPQNCTGGELYNLKVQSGLTYRLRLINPGTYAGLWFSIDSHNLTIIEADGTDIVPIELPGIFINIGQRYSVLINASQEVGNYIMRYITLFI